MTDLWPRLTTGKGIVELRKLDGDPAELRQMARNRHPQATYAASGGRRVTEDEVGRLAAAIRDAATDHGYPEPAGSAELVHFDRVAAEIIHRTMDITSVEASVREVWTFLAVVALPDVTRWRFHGDNVERWIATDLTRHMFSRLWWQATTFVVEDGDGARDYSLLRRLSESDLNQVMERRSIAGVSPLARSIARVLTEDQAMSGGRKALRDATPRLRRLMAFIDFTALSDEQLDDRVRSVFAGSR